jgi:transposase
MEAITIGFDLAKHWFQVHRVDAVGNIVVERRLRRAEVVAFFRAQEPCLVGTEACATARHWARELLTLVVSSQTLMAHSYRVIRRMRYGPGSSWERRPDRAAVFRVKRLEDATACDP